VNIAMTDRELLDQLSRDRSEAAFTELVRRHIDLVHSAALRQMGDAETARDITQQVFIEFARQAGRLPTAVILSGWLYRTTRHLCLETLRRDRRRREREHAAAEQLMNDATANPWEQVAPALEPAMDELGETDRQAILLRYFENRSLREVGAALGLGEDAAQKRVSRALDRLRDIFSRRGVSLSATALAGSLSAGAVQAAPAGLATAISTAALGGAAVATATTLATEGASTAMNLINLKTAAAILGAAAVTGTATYVVQERETEQLRAENTALNQTHAKLASDQQEALAMIQLRDEQIERLKRDVADLPRLRGEVDRLNRRLADFAAVNAERERLRAELDHLKESLANARTSLPDVRSVPAAQLTTEPVELETRTFRIQSDQLVARLRQATLGATPSATATEVFVSYLQQNGIQLNASDRVLLDEEQNRIVVRTETETMERITDLIGQLKDDVADAR
jgi:RNA polymerase sigma factor (sigma-70 family)